MRANQESTYVENGYEIYKWGRWAWGIYKTAEPSNLVKQIGKYAIQPTADWVSEQTGYSAFSTAASYGVEGAAMYANPAGYVVNYATSYLIERAADIVEERIIETLNINNPEAKAFLKILKTEGKNITNSKIAEKASKTDIGKKFNGKVQGAVKNTGKYIKNKLLGNDSEKSKTQKKKEFIKKKSLSKKKSDPKSNGKRNELNAGSQSKDKKGDSEKKETQKNPRKKKTVNNKSGVIPNKSKLLNDVEKSNKQKKKKTIEKKSISNKKSGAKSNDRHNESRAVSQPEGKKSGSGKKKIQKNPRNKKPDHNKRSMRGNKRGSPSLFGPTDNGRDPFRGNFESQARPSPTNNADASRNTDTPQKIVITTKVPVTETMESYEVTSKDGATSSGERLTVEDRNGNIYTEEQHYIRVEQQKIPCPSPFKGNKDIEQAVLDLAKDDSVKEVVYKRKKTQSTVPHDSVEYIQQLPPVNKSKSKNSNFKLVLSGAGVVATAPVSAPVAAVIGIGMVAVVSKQLLDGSKEAKRSKKAREAARKSVKKCSECNNLSTTQKAQLKDAKYHVNRAIKHLNAQKNRKKRTWGIGRLFNYEKDAIRKLAKHNKELGDLKKQLMNNKIFFPGQ